MSIRTVLCGAMCFSGAKSSTVQYAVLPCAYSTVRTAVHAVVPCTYSAVRTAVHAVVPCTYNTKFTAVHVVVPCTYSTLRTALYAECRIVNHLYYPAKQCRVFLKPNQSKAPR